MLQSEHRPCDQCQVAVINGIGTHEHGCPNHWLDPLTSKPKPAECYQCGMDFEPLSKGDLVCFECAAEYEDYNQ